MFLSPLSSSAGPVQVPAPPKFRGITGRVHNTDVIATPYVRVLGHTFAQKSGLRYEEKVHRYLGQVWLKYIPAPTVLFVDDTGFRRCIPDGILFLPDRTVLFEVKYQHMPEAWWQLKRLYQPVLEHHRKLPVQCIEVCRTYDPMTPFPEEVTLISDIRGAVTDSEVNKFGVFPWNK